MTTHSVIPTKVGIYCGNDNKKRKGNRKKIVVKAGFHHRRFCPVNFNIKKNLEKAKLVDLEENQEIPSRNKRDEIL